MKLFKIMGLCFIAAMALSAVMSASASRQRKTRNGRFVKKEPLVPASGKMLMQQTRWY